MKLVVIGPEELKLGFASAGAEFVSAETPQEALQHVIRHTSKKEVGMLLITAGLARSLREDLDRIRATYALPLILEIPDFEEKPLERAEWLSSVSTLFGIKV